MAMTAAVTATKAFGATSTTDEVLEGVISPASACW